MAKYNYRVMAPAKRDELLRQLARALSSVKGEKAMIQFLQTVLTPSEITMISRRLGVASKLLKGKTYREIRQELGVGLSTVATIDRWLNEILDNYHIPRVEKKVTRAITSRPRHRGTIPGTFADTRRRYSSKFLLINLLLDGIGYVD